MKILVVGGGSGGHITPAVAVVREIFNQKPRASVEFWTDFKYYKNVTKLTTEIGVSWGEENKSEHRGKGPYIRVRRIPAGKFHRYAGWKFKDYFVHLDITLKDLIFGNIVGFFGFVFGIFTAFFRLIRKSSRPNIIFLKGGYVCLPVGLIARLFRIPYIIHESDVVAGLANRLLMRKAKKVAFGMPLTEDILEKHPNYVWTGIPVGSEFKPVSPAKQLSLKKAFSFNAEKPLVVITGGSQGSENLNEATRQILPELLIGSVGAIMDVAITISSSIAELIEKNNKISVKSLNKSAKEIGKDIMSTMSNVLFFTYLCAGLPIFVLALRNGFTIFNYITTNFSLELSRFLVGSIGIVLTIPISAFISIKLMKRGAK